MSEKCSPRFTYVRQIVRMSFGNCIIQNCREIVNTNKKFGILAINCSGILLLFACSEPKYPGLPEHFPNVIERSAGWEELFGLKYPDITHMRHDLLSNQMIRELRQHYYACISYTDQIIGNILKVRKKKAIWLVAQLPAG